MASKLRVGMIGVGMMGLEHIANLKLHDDVAIVAIADPTPLSIDWAMGALGEAAAGVAVYADAQAMAAAERLDAVVVASPNHTHRAVLEPLWGAGVHILCEKPLCADIADAEAIAAKAERHDGVFWVGMEYRFMPPAARFIADVHGGRIGRLQMLALREHRFPFLPKVGDWNRFSRNTGGTMVEKCCHFFDLMRLITRAEPVRVYCSGAMDVNHQDERYDGKKPDIIDNSYTVVDFDNGVRAMLDLCMFADGSAEQEELCAVGDAAKLEAFVPSGRLVFSPRVGFMNDKRVATEVIDTDPVALAAGSHQGATFYQQKAWIEAIRTGGPAQVSAADGLAAVAMGVAAELSAREGRAVLMSELKGPHRPRLAFAS